MCIEDHHCWWNHVAGACCRLLKLLPWRIMLLLLVWRPIEDDCPGNCCYLYHDRCLQNYGHLGLSCLLWRLCCMDLKEREWLILAYCSTVEILYISPSQLLEFWSRFSCCLLFTEICLPSLWTYGKPCNVKFCPLCHISFVPHALCLAKMTTSCS